MRASCCTTDQRVSRCRGTTAVVVVVVEPRSAGKAPMCHWHLVRSAGGDGPDRSITSGVRRRAVCEVRLLHPLYVPPSGCCEGGGPWYPGRCPGLAYNALSGLRTPGPARLAEHTSRTPPPSQGSTAGETRPRVNGHARDQPTPQPTAHSLDRPRASRAQRCLSPTRGAGCEPVVGVAERYRYRYRPRPRWCGLLAARQISAPPGAVEPLPLSLSARRPTRRAVVVVVEPRPVGRAPMCRWHLVRSAGGDGADRSITTTVTLLPRDH
jgi:hypothetical protein